MRLSCVLARTAKTPARFALKWVAGIENRLISQRAPTEKCRTLTLCACARVSSVRYHIRCPTPWNACTAVTCPSSSDIIASIMHGLYALQLQAAGELRADAECFINYHTSMCMAGNSILPRPKCTCARALAMRRPLFDVGCIW